MGKNHVGKSDPAVKFGCKRLASAISSRIATVYGNVLDMGKFLAAPDIETHELGGIIERHWVLPPTFLMRCFDVLSGYEIFTSICRFVFLRGGAFCARCD
jgi:hypothetical protein